MTTAVSERSKQGNKVRVSSWQMAMRLLGREWRSGDLNLLAWALILAVMTVALTAFLADRLQRGMEQQAAQLMGGDLVLRSPRAIPDDWLDKARTEGLTVVPTMEFPSMVASDTGFQLSAVKAVSSGYPLKGQLGLAASMEDLAPIDSAGRLPVSGEVWVEPRLLSALNASVGDEIEIGQMLFRIRELVVKEPDRGGGFMSFNPRALINFTDVPATQVVQPGSRVTFRILFAGQPDQIDRFKAWLEPELEPAHRLLDVRQDRPSVGTALDRAQRYLQLTSIGAVILSGVAVAMAAARFARRRQDTVAVMASLGHTAQLMGGIYQRMLLVLGLIASLMGACLGYVLQASGISLIADLLPVYLPPASWQPWLLATGTGLLLLMGFASAPLMQLKQVSPLRVFRRDLDMATPSSALVYGLALVALVLLVFWYCGDLMLTLWLTLGLILVLVLSALITLGLFRVLKVVGPRLPSRPRLAIRSLYSHKQTALPQVMAFGLVLMVVALVALIRNDLLVSWQQQLPDSAPNHFAINIQPYEKDQFAATLDKAGVERSPLYPMVRARLELINGRPALEMVPEESREYNALHRELNLSWRSTLPDQNVVIDGQWWDNESLMTLPASKQAEGQGDQAGQTIIPMSLESGMAEHLALGMGDQLTFNLAGYRITGEVVNIRRVNWDNFQPNFYVLTPPGVLETLPQTLLASFYLPEGNRDLVPELVRQFPAVSLLDIGQILAQVRQILEQVTLAVEVMLGFTLLCGLILLLAAVRNSLDDRLREGALYRTLGASGAQIRQIQMIEFVLLGVLAGGLALMGSELTASLLYRNLFELEYSLSLSHWLVLPVSGGVIITLAGMWGTRHVIQLPPLQVLRAG
ncbi:ABC transporter permease [Oceanospirillum sediminis]|uniref:ABC transporter permease n=1 Tax=Oceanospirillum sediminis TaxID=2760088 RepID=A0A839IK70_9GAMM|nr:FtsX-like permease family protein [Oceanospirillum sediminis]MBB1485114.1 ABC transporter permease [Oceanospirillum sediminis]